MCEFSFIQNQPWLEYFLISFKEYHNIKNTDLPTYDDVINYAINNLNKIFINKWYSLAFSIHWIECIKSNHKIEGCRKSIGFGSRYVPNIKKFNPEFKDDKHKNTVLLAEYSYYYLYNHNEIEILLRTPSSDYTRYNIYDIIDNDFITNLRVGQKNQNNIDAILSTYSIIKLKNGQKLKSI